MKKLLSILAILAILLGFAGAFVYYTPTGQDALFKTAANAMFAGAQPVEYEGLNVIICGSASPLGRDPDRAQACVAVVTPEHLFLFDVGARAPDRINQAQLPLTRLNGIFITHFHSDHISDIPDVNLNSWVQGRKESMQVYGPEGVARVVNGFNEAFALDQGYRTAHHGEHMLPAEAGPMTPITINPGEIVWQDEDLTITAFLVEHPPIEPAVGYRVDYRDRSVVISGDTNASDNLFAAARDADLVVHDALSRTILDQMIAVASANNVPVLPTIMQDVIDYHADAHTLYDRTMEAGVQILAFYHLVPVPLNGLAENMFLRGLPSEIILTKDLHRFEMPTGSSEVIIHEP